MQNMKPARPDPTVSLNLFDSWNRHTPCTQFYRRIHSLSNFYRYVVKNCVIIFNTQRLDMAIQHLNETSKLIAPIIWL